MNSDWPPAISTRAEGSRSTPEGEEHLHQYLCCGITVVYAKVELLSLPIQQYKLPIPAQESNTKLLENAIEREMPLDPVWNIALKQSIAEPFKFRLRQPLLQKCAPQLTFLLGRQSGQIHAGPALILPPPARLHNKRKVCDRSGTASAAPRSRRTSTPAPQPHIIFRRVQQPGHTLRCLRLRELNAKIQVPELIVPEARDTVLPDNSRFAIVGKGQPDQFILAAQAKGLDPATPAGSHRSTGRRSPQIPELGDPAAHNRIAVGCHLFESCWTARTSFSGTESGKLPAWLDSPSVAMVCGANRRSAIFSK